MATSQIAYQPEAGRSYVDLTSWAGDASFATTPVSGDQIEGPDALTLNPDGPITGPDGTYTLRHLIAANGTVESLSYVIDTSTTVSTNGTFSPPSGYTSVTLTGTIVADNQFTTQPVAGEQIWFGSGITVDAQLNITGTSELSTIYHVKLDGTTDAIEYSIPKEAAFDVNESATADDSATVQKVAASSATATVGYQPGTGRQFVTLTSWAGDITFTTTPVAGDQIEAPDTVTLDTTGVITGPVGTYTIRHIKADGSVEAVSYTIADSSATVTETGTLSPPTGYTSVTLSGTITAVSEFTIQPVVDDQIWFPAEVTVTAQLDITGVNGTHTLYHVRNDGTTESVAYTIGAAKTLDVSESATASDSVTVQNPATALSSATTTVPYQPTVTMTLTTLVEPIDPYNFQSWSAQPVAGEQLISTTSEGVFDANGNWSGDAEGVFTYWFIDLNGTITARTIDTANLPVATGAVTAQATFGFGAGNTTTTLADPIDPYLFENWSAAQQPVAGEQITIADSNGTFTVNGELDTLVEGMIDVYHTDNSGVVSALQVDSTGLTEVAPEALAISEGVTFSEVLELAKTASFTLSESATIDLQLNEASAETKLFTLSEAATVRTFSAILPDNYITPIVTLPSTDLNAGYDSNYQTEEIQLYQGSWHKLIAPINIGGADITNISRARLQLFRGPEVVLTLTLNDNISFEGSTLYIELDETDTVNLIQGYQYELWVMDLKSNPLFVRSGKIVFKPTQLRF